MKIAHARSSETLGKNGVKGDQTKKEVCITEYYNNGYNVVLRASTKKLADTIADNIVKACKNDNIGYSQNNRNTLYQELVKHNYDITKVGLCNCDCSSLVHACIIASGIKNIPIYNNSATTRTLKNLLLNSGHFKAISTKDPLQKGDICLKEGSHVFVVVSEDKETKPLTYTVVKGDTLSKIAKEHKTTVKKLVELNDIKDKNKIYVGEVIKLC